MKRSVWAKALSMVLVLAMAAVWLPAGSASAAPPSFKTKPMVAAGNYHTVALKADGTVWAWGSNTYGQLGNGNSISSYVPVQVSGLSNITAIAAGNLHSIALKADGTVWTWGNNGNGQLGNGTATSTRVPVQVKSLSGVIAVEAGYSRTYAVKSNGTVWGWGFNLAYSFANTLDTDSHVPIQIQGVSGAAAVTSGMVGTFARKSDGTVWNWGGNIYTLGYRYTINRSDYITDSPYQAQYMLSFENDIPVPLTGVTAMAAGDYHTVAVSSGGTIWSWGNEQYGQCGVGDSRSTGHVGNIVISSMFGVTALAAGYAHTVVLASGRVWTWGYNNLGQLGNGTTENSSERVPVPGMAGVTAIGAGLYHTVAAKSDGTVWAWGNNGNGQLGDGTTTSSVLPVKVPNFNLGESGFQLTATPTKGGAVSGDPNGTYEEGNLISLMAVPDHGYEFDRWGGSGIILGEEDRLSPDIQFTMPANDVTLTAYFKEKKPYTLSVTAGEGGYVGGDSGGEYYEGDNITVSAWPDHTYEFDHWAVSGISLGSEALTGRELSFTMPGNAVSVSAVFKQWPYVTWYDCKGGYYWNDTGGSGYCEPGTRVGRWYRTEPGYRLAGWTVSGVTPDTETITTILPEDVDSSMISFIMPDNDVYLSPDVRQVKYTLSRSAHGGGTVSGALSGLYEKDTVITLTATPDKGFKFDGWTGTGLNTLPALAAYTTISFPMPASDVSLQANFKPITIGPGEGQGNDDPGADGGFPVVELDREKSINEIKNNLTDAILHFINGSSPGGALPALRALNLNGHALAMTVSGDTVQLAGYPGYSGGIGTFTVSPDSVIVTFDKAFLKTLPEGAQTLSAQFDTDEGQLQTIDAELTLVRNVPGVVVSGKIRSYNPGNPTTVKLMQGGAEKYTATIAATAGFGQTDQTFTFENVAPGDYTLAVTKPGHTSFTVQTITVGDTDLDLTRDTRDAVKVMTLLCGDINGDGMINDNDLIVLWQAANYNKNAEQAANPLCDLNGDRVINDNDLIILWLAVNYNKGPVVAP